MIEISYYMSRQQCTVRTMRARKDLSHKRKKVLLNTYIPTTTISVSTTIHTYLVLHTTTVLQDTTSHMDFTCTTTTTYSAILHRIHTYAQQNKNTHKSFNYLKRDSICNYYYYYYRKRLSFLRIDEKDNNKDNEKNLIETFETRCSSLISDYVCAKYERKHIIVRWCEFKGSFTLSDEDM